MSNTPHLELPNIFIHKGLRCRAYTISDNTKIVEIVNQAFSYQDTKKGEPRTTSDQIDSYSKKYELYVITKNNELIGCVYTSRVNTTLRFGLLALIKEYRGVGLGNTIMESIIELAKSSYCSAVELDYLSAAPWLKSYYEKYGFTETGDVEEWRGMQMIKMRRSLS